MIGFGIPHPRHRRSKGLQSRGGEKQGVFLDFVVREAKSKRARKSPHPVSRLSGLVEAMDGLQVSASRRGRKGTRSVVTLSVDSGPDEGGERLRISSVSYGGCRAIPRLVLGLVLSISSGSSASSGNPRCSG
jgi:hypothetical protein